MYPQRPSSVLPPVPKYRTLSGVQSPGQCQFTGVSETSLNIQLESTGHSPGVGSPWVLPDSKQMLDMDANTFGGIQPIDSGNIQQVSRHPAMPSITNGTVNPKPAVALPKLAVTKPRVHIVVPHDGRILDITEEFVKQIHSVMYPQRPSSVLPPVPKYRTLSGVQSPGQCQFTGVSETSLNIQLESTGHSPGVESPWVLPDCKQMLDMDANTFGGIQPSDSGNIQQVSRHPAMPSITNGTVNPKPAVALPKLAVTKPRVDIVVPHDGRILDIIEEFVKQIHSVMYPQRPSSVLPPVPKYRTLSGVQSPGQCQFTGVSETSLNIQLESTGHSPGVESPWVLPDSKQMLDMDANTFGGIQPSDSGNIQQVSRHPAMPSITNGTVNPKPAVALPKLAVTKARVDIVAPHDGRILDIIEEFVKQIDSVKYPLRPSSVLPPVPKYRTLSGVQSPCQCQFTGVSETSLNIQLESTGHSPGVGSPWVLPDSKQMLDMDANTFGGIQPIDSGNIQQVSRHPAMPSITNGTVNPKPAVALPKLAVTKPRVDIVVPHDGRILDITEEFVKQFTEDKSYGDIVGNGAYATVYRSKDEVLNMDINIVIKKICCKTGGNFNEPKRRSATNEILAARLLHFAIVPLLGMWEDIDHTMYFLLPFLEKGDLFEALGNDMSNIEYNKVVCLKQDIRLRIIYHIASAMKFIHTKVEAFRGAYVHGDITSRNIVLDGNLNARLTDFGLARELADKGSLTMTLSEQFGTRGYFLTANMQELTVRRDCYSFGVVLLELLTSLTPVDEETGDMLREKKNLLTYKRNQIKAVWKDPRVDVGIHKIAQDCLNIKTEYSSGHIMKELKGLTRNKFFVTNEDKFAQGELPNQPKCHVCMLNPAMANDYQGNHGLCTQLQVCVSCLRNSYFNPIKCHTCENDVRSPIGNGWGAILVAGNDEDNAQMAKVFEADMELIYRTSSSKYPHIMGISEKFIQRVSPSKSGTEESMTEPFKAAFETLRGIPEIHTLLFFFSGHYTKKSGFRLGSRTDCVTREEVTQELIDCKAVKKRIIFIDCCDAPVFDSKAFPRDTTLQLNACDESTGEKSRVDNNCSPFVRFLAQGMWQKAWPKGCFLSEAKLGPPDCKICNNYKEGQRNDHLISFADLQEYVGKHMKYIREKQTPVKLEDAKYYTQDKVAYCIDKRSEREFYFRHDLHECDTKGREVVYTCDSLPDSVQELRQNLMKEFLFKDPSACRLPSSLVKYSDVICVVMTLGPKSEHYRELDTIPKMAAAWNGKRRLHYGFRKLKNLQLGKVGLFLQTYAMESARTIHSHLAAVGEKEPQEQDQQHDVITIKRNQIVEIYDVLQTVSNNEEKRRSLKRLLHILEDVDQHTEEGGLLYFTFPYQTDTTLPNERFMVIEHRTSTLDM